MINFDDTNLDLIKFYALIGVGLTIATLSWITLYVIPHDTVNQQIAMCQMDIGDRSYEGYEYCVNKLKPSHK